MRKLLVLLAPVVAFSAVPSAAFAGHATVTGAAGGAVTGAIIGGPPGAVIGGFAGAVAGTVFDPPPPPVEEYVVEQPVASVVIPGEVVVGAPLPPAVVLYAVPPSVYPEAEIYPEAEPAPYSFAMVNDQYVIVDPHTRVVVDIAD